MSIESARRDCLLADSYSRMEAVIGRHPRSRFTGPKLRQDAWWRLLGEQWSACDNINEWSEVIRQLMLSAPRQHLDLMMSIDERLELASMPEEFTVWRGCYGFNREGLSWSLDRDVAASFPTLNRYRHESHSPQLIEGVCRRRDAVLKNDRGEREVITSAVRVVSIFDLQRA